ncbi:MAG: NAD(P)H-binding protein [Bacteroidota bacterium]
MKAIIVGATGLVGNELLHLILEHVSFSHVKVFVRHKILLEHPKLEQIEIDFNQLHNYAHEFNGDMVFCTLGTTINKAGSKDAFIQVDYTYPLQIASICAQQNISQFHLVTAMGASSSSNIFYNKVKGNIEEAIQKLTLETFVVYRPSMLLGNRKENRVGEKIGQILMTSLDFMFVGWLKKYKAIQAKDVAKAMIIQSLKNKKGFHVIESDKILEIANYYIATNNKN